MSVEQTRDVVQRYWNADHGDINTVFGEGVAVLEADFVGRPIGEFAGVPATGKDVRVPLAVVYDVRDGVIVQGRVYFETPAFLAQVGR
jgi:predicted ester cyclase